MSSGSYHPPPVRLVEIPKDTGGTRPLGIPTISDRVAQTVAKMVLEPLVEPRFHPDSYGYRPGRSALDAVGVARKRCWETDWVIDLDIRSFFDSIPHDLVERAVAHHTDLAWVRLYVGRWLRAPVERPDGLARNGRKAPRKEASPVRCSPTCSCTTRSTCGCIGAIRAFGSSDMLTMRSSIAGARRKPGRCWRPSGVDWQNAAWSFTLRRPGSSTARMTTGRGNTSISSSTSSATPSNLDVRRTGGGVSLSASCRPSATRPPQRSGKPFANGEWHPPGTTSAWRIWLALPTRWCRAG